MNILKITISVLSIITFSFCSSALNSRQENHLGEYQKTLKLMQGGWQSTEDSLAGLRIANDTLLFTYKISGVPLVTDYMITLTNKLPQNVNPTQEAEVLVLTNEIDTLYYEILGLNDLTLSLQSYPSSNRFLYTRQKL